MLWKLEMKSGRMWKGTEQKRQRCHVVKTLDVEQLDNVLS